MKTKVTYKCDECDGYPCILTTIECVEGEQDGELGCPYGEPNCEWVMSSETNV